MLNEYIQSTTEKLNVLKEMVNENPSAIREMIDSIIWNNNERDGESGMFTEEQVDQVTATFRGLVNGLEITSLDKPTVLLVEQAADSNPVLNAIFQLCHHRDQTIPAYEGWWERWTNGDDTIFGNMFYASNYHIDDQRKAFLEVDEYVKEWNSNHVSQLKFKLTSDIDGFIEQWWHDRVYDLNEAHARHGQYDPQGTMPDALYGRMWKSERACQRLSQLQKHLKQ